MPLGPLHSAIAGALKTGAGVAAVGATYTRPAYGGDPELVLLDVDITRGQRDYDYMDDQGATIQAVMETGIVATTSLAVEDVPFAPRQGDTIEFESPGGNETFKVGSDENGRCWKWSDPTTQCQRIIHLTK